MSQDTDHNVLEEIEDQLRRQDRGSLLAPAAHTAARVAVRAAGWSGVMIASSRLAMISLSAVIHRALASVEPRRSIPPALPK